MTREENPDFHVLAARWSEKSRRMREEGDCLSPIMGGQREAAADQLDACAAQLRALLMNGDRRNE